jgi:membrane-bound metal-dependent hydrolase YbcI (DUF457 family)
MANREDHDQFGAALSALVALLRSDAEKDGSMEVVLRVAAAYIGGKVGAKVPDWLEPAVSSWHRKTAHSIVAGAIVFEITRRRIDAWEEHCRAKQAEARLANNQADVCFWAAASGFGPAIATGYISHLVLDAQTPRGIPWV